MGVDSCACGCDLFLGFQVVAPALDVGGGHAGRVHFDVVLHLQMLRNGLGNYRLYATFGFDWGWRVTDRPNGASGTQSAHFGP